MKLQQEGQRWHLEEQEHFLVHEVGLHHKQQYCAANKGQILTAKTKYKKCGFKYS